MMEKAKETWPNNRLRGTCLPRQKDGKSVRNLVQARAKALLQGPNKSGAAEGGGFQFHLKIHGSVGLVLCLSIRPACSTPPF
mmetsp:Transcript_9647/g.29361  ORF Transcript_9647/g.29361 Transcript_9647/m.29361 type:complete len:82 (+) Transcript_9647:770-1015(+)